MPELAGCLARVGLIGDVNRLACRSLLVTFSTCDRRAEGKSGSRSFIHAGTGSHEDGIALRVKIDSEID